MEVLTDGQSIKVDRFMPRIVKEHNVRRNEILDAALRLIYAKGYERMTIQDILDDLHIAKGLFYYYFESKQAMLIALIERMMELLEEQLAPIIHDPNLRATEKLQRFFGTIVSWETEQKTFLLMLMPVLYLDDNAIVREKIRTTLIRLDAPLLTVIIRQGVEEGSWQTPYPDHAGELALLLFEGLKDTVAQHLLLPEPQRHDLRHVEVTIAAYTDALERILGVPPNTLRFVDARTLNAWFDASVGTKIVT